MPLSDSQIEYLQDILDTMENSTGDTKIILERIESLLKATQYLVVDRLTKQNIYLEKMLELAQFNVIKMPARKEEDV